MIERGCCYHVKITEIKGQKIPLTQHGGQKALGYNVKPWMEANSYPDVLIYGEKPDILNV